VAGISIEKDDSPGDSPSRLSALAASLVGMLILAAVLNYIDRLTTSALAPTLKEEFTLKATEWGWVNSSFALAYIVGSLLGGMWIDRVGVRKGMVASIVLWSLAAMGHAFATGFWSLCFWRMLLALGEGPGIPCMLKGMRRLMPPAQRDMGTGLIFAGGAAGALLAPLCVIPIANLYGWQAGFLVTGGAGLIWAPIWWLLSAKPSLRLGNEAVKLTASSDTPPKPLEWQSLTLWATLLAIFFTVPPTVYANAFLPLHLNTDFGQTQEQMAKYLWQPFLAVDIGQLVGGFAAAWLIKRHWSYLSARRIVMCCGFIGATCILGMNFETDVQRALNWLNASRFCYQAAYTVLLAYGVESVAENQTAFMAGLMNATFSACNFVFSPIIGYLADHHGYRSVILMIGLVPLLGLVCWIVLSRIPVARQNAAALQPAATTADTAAR